jgi:hypothetical protein
MSFNSCILGVQCCSCRFGSQKGNVPVAIPHEAQDLKVLWQVFTTFIAMALTGITSSHSSASAARTTGECAGMPHNFRSFVSRRLCTRWTAVTPTYFFSSSVCSRNSVTSCRRGLRGDPDGLQHQVPLRLGSSLSCRARGFGHFSCLARFE